MAQSGYGYDPLHGYHQQAPYAHQPYPSYPASYPNGAVQTIVHNEPAPRDPYNPHNVIPGLGLNFSQDAAQWPAPWAHQPSFGQAPPAAIEENGPLQQTDMSEEGEVSEGEAEDVYEPRGAEVVADTSYMHRHAGYSAGFSNANGRQVADDPSAVYSVGRDRSGSYSPYLSPQEIDHQAMSGSPDEPQSNHVTPPKSSQSSPKTNGASQTISNSSPVKSVAAARKQAQDAILRLWPLNVRYQNYVDEGINETLLGGLFEELGFDMALPSDIAATESGHEKEAASGTKDETLHTDSKQRQTDAGEKLASAPMKDKSEERKDRIARLLAAKSSKPSTSASAASAPARAPAIASASTPSAHTPIPRQQAPAKTQSEKSKLLYQKMEALRKARELEARGQKRPHPDVLTRQNHQAKDNAGDSTTTTAISFDTSTSGIHSISRGNTPGQSESPNGQAPSIPGLFLSSTPQPTHPVQILNLERPASTSLVDSNPRPFKRPFGQTRRSRPFLIDVSDDEDDAEMDLDSPEQKVVVLATRPNPALKTSISLRSIPSTIDNVAAAQQYSSPLTTPPGSGSDSHARDNLDNMTKKIEAMKRRIAEAEARKKARQLRPDSPALPTLNDDSPSGSFEVAITNKDTTMPAFPSIEPRELSHSTPSISDPSPGVLPQLPESSPRSGNELRRSLSRAASERLPVIEARRREQQLKLQLLQAQVANIQHEIQRSLEEEEKLKVDVSIESESEQTQERQYEALTPSKPPSPSSPLTDAMDMASISPQSNNATRHVREASLHQIEESWEEQQPGMLTTAQDEQSLPIDGLTTSQAAIAAIVVVDNANQEAIQSAMSTQEDASTTVVVEETQDMAISDGGSNNADSEDGSDDYEPPDVELSSPSRKLSRASTPFSPAPADMVSIPETSPNGFQDQDNMTDVIATQQISTFQQDTASESGREVDVALHVKGRPLYLIANQVDQVSEALPAPAPAPAPASDTLQTAFVPYESPLRYFHAYRFHPEYSQSVAGGLRSLTYSNKIDVKQEMCPDELANDSCPRGKECVFQHFENMQAPDDQILLQLGAHDDFEEQKKHEYINGLRHLLTDYRNRKVKDFQTISQGIIDYRAQFLGDRSKILPLGGVTI